MNDLLRLFSPSIDFILADTAANPEWRTKSEYRLTPAELVRTWTDPKKLIGIRPGKKNHWLLLDIDRGSEYHPYNDRDNWDSLLYRLEQIGLIDHNLIRSSNSGGIHLYHVLSEAVNSFGAAALVQMHLTQAKIYLGAGQIEQFPNTKSFDTNYKPVRLPFQSGSTILDINGDEWISHHNLSSDTRMAYLVSQIENNQNDLKLFKSKLAWGTKTYKKQQHQQRQPRRSETKTDLWERNWDETIEMGWSGRGQTNDLLHAITGRGIVFRGITDLKELCAHVKTIVLTSPGYQRHCNHQHHIDQRIRGCAKWCLNRRKYYPLPSRFGSPQQQHRPTSTERTDGVIAKIQRAIALVVERCGQLPQKLTDRLAAIMTAARELGAGIAKNTLYKPRYKPLWQQAETAENRQSTETQTETTVSHILSEKINIFDEEIELETQTEAAVSHIHVPMKLCISQVPIADSLKLVDDLTILTRYYNSRDFDIVTRKLGKFEILTSALAKIIVVDAIVVNLGRAATPESLDMEEISTTQAEPIDLAPGAVPQTLVVDSYNPDPPLIAPPRMHQMQQERGDVCPECEIFVPPTELEQWAMCRFCAQKNLWQRRE